MRKIAYKQTYRQTNNDENITSLTEVKMNFTPEMEYFGGLGAVLFMLKSGDNLH